MRTYEVDVYPLHRTGERRTLMSYLRERGLRAITVAGPGGPVTREFTVQQIAMERFLSPGRRA